MMTSTSRALLALLFPLLLAACGGNDTAALLASAKGYLAKQDSKAAIIQIKNALQAKPDLAEARYLLGIALLDDGNPAAAEVELRKALSLKYSPEQVVPRLAASMVEQGQNKRLIDEFGATKLDAAATADLQTSIALAQLALGNAAGTQTAVDAALAADPNFVPALIAQARQMAARGDTERALAALGAILERTPSSKEAWKLRGDVLLFSKNQPDQALADYRKAIEIKSDFVPAQHAILGVLIQQDKAEEAQTQLTQLKKVAPNHPQTKFIEALLAYGKGDLKLARDLTQQLMKLAPDSPSLLVLAGSIELQANSLLQAEAYLARAVQLAPKAVVARRLLVSTFLRSNQPDKALTALLGAQTKDEIAPELYSVAGEVFLQNGDAKTASDFFNAASKLDPTDASKKTSVALMRFVGGDPQVALTDLKSIAQTDKGVSADMALISLYLKRNEWDKALEGIDSLELKTPKQPIAANLRGRTLLGKGDTSGARKAFEQALSIAPGYFPAAASLASLDLADKKPEDARKRMEAVLAKEPRNAAAQLVIADLAAASGGTKDEVAALIGKAIAADPSDSAARLRLIAFYLRSNDTKQAMSLAQQAAASFPDRPEFLDALAQTQKQAGEFNQALANYNRLAGLQPNSPLPYLRLAETYMAMSNKQDAERALRKALSIKHDLLDAQRGLIGIALASANFQNATAVARTVQTQRPREDIGFAMEGDIAAAQKNWSAAIVAYRAGLKQAPTTVLAVNLHTALVTSGNLAEAARFSGDWRKDHPEDAPFIFHLGDVALARNDLAAAEAAYLSVTKLQPANASAFNNLAWVSNQSNKSAAIAYAEQANKLAPNQPAFMDTWATVLGDNKQYDKALELQKKAMELNPADGSLKLNLAKLLIKSGDKAGARHELDQLASLGAKFDGQAEVTTLLKGL